MTLMSGDGNEIFRLIKGQIGHLTQMVAREHFTVLACEICYLLYQQAGLWVQLHLQLSFKETPTATWDQDVTDLYFNQISTFASRGRSMWISSPAEHITIAAKNNYQKKMVLKFDPTDVRSANMEPHA